MKQKISLNYSNEEYIHFIEGDLTILLRSGDQKQILKIQKKLSPEHRQIFDKVVFYRTAEDIVNINYNVELAAKERDWDRTKKLSEFKNEINGHYRDYVKSISPDIFLEAIANITYAFAKVELDKQLMLHKEFLGTWFQWDAYLHSKNKNKRKGVIIKEKLRIILGNQIEDIEKIFEEHKSATIRAVDGRSDIFVNIDNEIDVEQSTITPNFVLPRRLEASNILVIEEHTKCINFESEEYSLYEYYEKIRDSIDSSWLRDKDLLKKVAIVYMIKRCQSGDEDAFNRLFNLYKDKAQQRATRFIKKKAFQYKNSDSFNVGGSLSEESAQSVVLEFLEKLLRGDNPSNIYKYLDKNRSEKEDVTFLNKKPHLGMQEGYEALFAVFNGQYKLLQEKKKEFSKSTKDILYRHKTAKKNITKSEYMQKLFAISHRLLMRTSSAPTMFSLLNPLSILSISSSYNRRLYKPSKGHNLTQWLFGKKGEFSGKLDEDLNDWFKRNTYTKDGKRLVPEDDYGYNQTEGFSDDTEDYFD